MEAGSSGASSARVKEPDVMLASFAHVKKELDALAPPSMKKACRLVEDATRQLEY
jgi:hypothetical protein